MFITIKITICSKNMFIKTQYIDFIIIMIGA